MIFQWVTFVLCTMWLTRWMWHRRKLYILSWRMPGPVAFPFVGSALSLIFQGTYLYNRQAAHFNLPYVFRFCELAASLFGLFVFALCTEKLRFLEVISKRFDHLNSPLRIWLGTKMFLYCDNIEDVETVLMSPNCIDRDDLYQYLNEALGVNGIFTLKGGAK